VYGSIHGCVDFVLLARVIFVSFSSPFVRFSCATCSFDYEAFVFSFVCGDYG
jgi:hypothetical protein